MTKSIPLLLFFLIGLLTVDAGFFFIQDSTSVSDTTVADSTSMLDSTKTIVKKDTLKPIAITDLFGENVMGSKMTRDDIRKTDYRYTGSFFNNLPFGYLADLGSVGNPDEVHLFGLGFSNISYLQNGVPINNRFQNAFDLNLMQSESIDSITVSSLSSGFLYNSLNNPVTVNFNTRLKVDPRPYSRLRFYQGPDNEGLIDGMFSAYPAKRINVSFQITNQSADSRYVNSELSNWMFNTRVRFMPSNSINIITGYDFSKKDMGLNGGVNAAATPTLLYDNIQAEVNFDDRYHKNTGHHLFLKSIFKVDSVSYTDLTLYYQDQLDEFRQNEFASDTTIESIKNDNGYKTTGAFVNQEFYHNIFKFQFLARYERTEFNVEWQEPNIDFMPTITKYSSDLWSVGGRMSAIFSDNLVQSSVFLKLSELDDRSLFGWGANLNLNISNNLAFFTGYSSYDRAHHSSMGEINIFEAGLKTKLPFAAFNLSYFNINHTYYSFPITFVEGNIESVYNASSFVGYANNDFERSGISLKAQVDLWKLRFISNSSYYFNESKFADPTIPEITSFGGFYYVDTLFNTNLDLKAGVNYKFYSERNFAIYDFQLLRSAFHESSGKELTGVNGASQTQLGYQFDLFIAATIRERATIYIAFENLMNYQYYVIPYYPVQPSGLLIGFTWEFLD